MARSRSRFIHHRKEKTDAKWRGSTTVSQYPARKLPQHCNPIVVEAQRPCMEVSLRSDLSQEDLHRVIFIDSSASFQIPMSSSSDYHRFSLMLDDPSSSYHLYRNYRNAEVTSDIDFLTLLKAKLTSPAPFIPPAPSEVEKLEKKLKDGLRECNKKWEEKEWREELASAEARDTVVEKEIETLMKRLEKKEECERWQGDKQALEFQRKIEVDRGK